MREPAPQFLRDALDAMKREAVGAGRYWVPRPLEPGMTLIEHIDFCGKWFPKTRRGK